METVSAGPNEARPDPVDEAARKRAAVETYTRNEATLRRTAGRYSLCADDAEDALQRGLEILLRKAPTDDPRELIKWMQTVVKHEALAIRRERERILAGPAAAKPEPDMDDWVALLPAPTDGPADRAERREAVARSREALQGLKPPELRALTLLAEGYSYAEIGAITGYSRTKVNRCLAEGRARFRQLLARSEDGGRCLEMGPLISAFCDGEAKAEEVAELREHLRACPRCRATLRTYRAAPGAAAALAPALPLPRSLWERIRDAVADLWGRSDGSGADPVTQAAAGSGAGAVGTAALAKVAAVCIGTAGGAAACVAGGLVPSPVDLSTDHHRPPRLERSVADLPVSEEAAPVDESPTESAAPDPESKPDPEPTQTVPPAEGEAVAPEPAPVESAPVESAPAPEPVPEPAAASSAGSGSPAGEFGP